MSLTEDVNFKVFFKGRFVILQDGELTYDGGEIHIHHSPVEALFNGLGEALGISLNGQRIWFKFSWENMDKWKVLCVGSDNFQMMVEADDCIEIYLEADDIIGDEVPQERIDGDESEDGNDGDEPESGNESGEDEDNENAVYEDEQTVKCEEEDRVEALVASIIDSEEEDDAHKTPPNSDSEEEFPRDKYVRYRKGSRKLEILQVFESVRDFKEAVLEYALLNGYNIRYGRGGSIQSDATCGVKDEEIKCPWRIYCSFDPQSGKYMVKTFQEEHTCNKDGRCRILSDTVIAKLFINDVRTDPKIKPKVMEQMIEKRYNLVSTYDQCIKARTKALNQIEADFDEQFSRIKDYEAEILRTNRGSTTKLITIQSEDGKEKLDRFYVCFSALRKIWVRHCRRIFGIDGCFLKSTSKGQLLTADGRDSNNQIYPIAWAYVQVESTYTWAWFIELLKRDLRLRDGDGFTLVSDRQKGLLKVVGQQLPKVEHRMCARHIYGNLRGKFPKKARLQSLFWSVVESHNLADYAASLKEVEKYDLTLYQDLMAKKPETFSRAYFKTTSCCEDDLNNFSESYNSAIEKARALPLVEMLETMRRQTMIRIDQRKEKTLKHKAKFSLKVSKMIALEEKERKWCKTIPGPTGIFECDENGTSHTVNMRKHTCTCRRWDLTGIPCRHALRVVLDRKTYKTEDLVSDWYLTTTWRQQYNDSITPLDGLRFWKKTGKSRLEAPPRDISMGRKKNPEKRRRSVNESPKKGKKATQHGRTVTCCYCGMDGHNSSSCTNVGVPKKPRPPKKRKTQPGQADTLMNDGEGPSQTQPSQPTTNE